MIVVVCGILEKDGVVLACRRNAGKVRGGKWEFPGGKVKEGETPEEAIRRELFEELSLDVHPDKRLGWVEHSYPDMSIRLLAVSCFINGGELRLTDHDAFRWIPFTELASVDFSEADRLLIDRIGLG
jgi:8-oxo-dGTP diphosphatase